MATDTEQLVVQLEARIRDFERNMQKANRTAQRQFGSIERRGAQASKRLQTTFATMGRGLTSVLGPLTAGAAVVAVTKITSEISELGKQARSVGLTAEAFQELRFGMGQAGIDASRFSTAMEAFTQRIGQAVTGSGQLADVLERNGVALRDAAGTMRPTLDLLRDFADLVKIAKSEQEAMNVAAMAFGERGGRQMVRALRDGSAGVDKLMKRARDASVVIGNDLVDAAERVDDRFDKLSKTTAPASRRPCSAQSTPLTSFWSASGR